MALNYKKLYEQELAKSKKQVKTTKTTKTKQELNEYYSISYKAVNGWDIKLLGTSYPSSAKACWDALVKAGDYSELKFSKAEWPSNRDLAHSDFEVVKIHRGTGN